jgi:hypothetical protein
MHTKLQPRRMARPAARHPRCFTRAMRGVRLDQMPDPLLHRTWLRKQGRVIPLILEAVERSGTGKGSHES